MIYHATGQCRPNERRAELSIHNLDIAFARQFVSLSSRFQHSYPYIGPSQPSTAVDWDLEPTNQQKDVAQIYFFFCPPQTQPTMSPSPLQQAFTIRRAGFTDLPAAARLCSLAFWDDVLFGRLIHPHRVAYPFDFDKYWYRRFAVDWWDQSHVFLLATNTVSEVANGKTTSREVVTGLAHWSRVATPQANYDAGWERRWWDPSEY